MPKAPGQRPLAWSQVGKPSLGEVTAAPWAAGTRAWEYLLGPLE